MVQSVAGLTAGNYYYSSGAPINSREYDVQKSRLKQMQQIYGEDLDFKSSLFLSGVDGNVVLQKIENDIEGNGGDGVSGNTLSWDRYITSEKNPNDYVFQSFNGGTYTNLNVDQNRVYQMSERQFAYQLGVFGDLSTKPYDLAIFGQDSANFVEYKFSGFEDGQQAMTLDLSKADNARWGHNTSYVVQEFNPFAADFNPYSIGEAGISNSIFKQITNNSAQWMTNSDRNYLVDNSIDDVSYYKALTALVIAKFDQANETLNWYS